MFQIITGDNWAENITVPLEGYIPVFSYFYFSIFYLFMTIIFLGIFQSVILGSILNSYDKDDKIINENIEINDLIKEINLKLEKYVKL
jgi:hypothetical protein